MKRLIIKIIAVLLLGQIGYSQTVDEFVLQSVAINDSGKNEGVSFYTQNHIIYTLEKADKNIHDTDFYVSMADESGTVLEGTLLEGDLNSYINEVDLVFTADFKKVYFTRSYIGNNKKEHFDIYQADVTEENKFINLKTLPINYQKYSTTNPCLSSDDKTLYFASNRLESLGGFDIFKVAIHNNGRGFGKVINLGANVNSKGDEITPFVIKDKLYFSSNGRNGFGKLDVFLTDINATQRAENLGETINSSENDFDFIRKEHRNYGYLSSDRKTGKGKSDIYFFKVIEVAAPIIEVIEVEVVEASKVIEVVETPKIVEVVEAPKVIEVLEAPKVVEVVETPKVIEVVETPKVIEVPKAVVVVEKVEVIDSKDTGYIEEITYEEKTEVADNVYDFQRRIAYNTTMKETGRVLKKKAEYTAQEKTCVDDVARLDDIYFNLNKFNIRPDAQLQINKAIKIMEKCPNINFIASSFTDSRGSSEYNRVLSQRRATSVVSYILQNSSIPANRIQGVGFGESGLKNKCYNGIKCTERKHQENRRTEIEVYVYKQ